MGNLHDYPEPVDPPDADGEQATYLDLESGRLYSVKSVRFDRNGAAGGDLIAVLRGLAAGGQR